ncbi:MAG: BtpA/SgcQ family protein [Thermomicrobium sp.]|nr:BtpA/SgcQ family protein [Thermomicrobium sp.]
MQGRVDMTQVFASNERFALVGVVHLLPLPGSPRARHFAEVRDRALRDAEAYARGGIDALLVENFGDVPFRKDAVEPHVVAAMTLVVDAIQRATGLPVGVNVLRNDARAALAIAAMTGAGFIRVNVHVGAMLTDQGIVEGRADETLRYRTMLGATVQIWADVLVKHAVPLAPVPLEEVARDTVERGLADALIVTGPATGRPPDPAELARLGQVLPGVPVLVGSGVTAENVRRFVSLASGAIVGTWAKVDGLVHNPVDEHRVRALVNIVRGL